MIWSPGAAVELDAVLTIARSVLSRMTTSAEAVLLAAFSSRVRLVSVAVLRTVPAVAPPTLTRIVAVALAPAARSPTAQVTVPEALLQPLLASAF